jgi:hypothetical protein
VLPVHERDRAIAKRETPKGNNGVHRPWCLFENSGAAYKMPRGNPQCFLMSTRSSPVALRVLLLKRPSRSTFRRKGDSVLRSLKLTTSVKPTSFMKTATKKTL